MYIICYIDLSYTVRCRQSGVEEAAETENRESLRIYNTLRPIIFRSGIPQCTRVCVYERGSHIKYLNRI